MIKTREPSPEMAAASKPSGFRIKRRAWREEETANSATTNKLATNGEQSDNKLVTNGEQSDNENRETDNKRISKPITSRLTKGEQSDNKRITKTSFFELIGLQRKVTLYVYDSCKLTRSSVSGPITLEAMSINLESPKGSVKTTTNRLRKKRVIQTIYQKEGRGGFTKYRLDDSIYQEILHNESVNNRITKGEQSDNKRISKPITEPITSLSSSSSINVLEDFKTTTTSETKSVGNGAPQLNPEWLEIDCSSLSEIHFSRTQLFQIAQIGKLTPTVVQDSIDAFAFDLKNNNKGKELKTAPLNFFMGILRRGMPYAPPENYESPQDEAERKYLEAKRVQAARRQAMQKERFELEFQEWKDNLTSVQRRELAPHAKIDGSEMQTAALRQYFKETVQNGNTNLGLESPDVPQGIRKQIDQSLD